VTRGAGGQANQKSRPHPNIHSYYSMKFCKTLQRAVEISDPSYVPYWTNYKRLKKLVKAIVQADEDAYNDDEATEEKQEGYSTKTRRVPPAGPERRPATTAAQHHRHPDHDDDEPYQQQQQHPSHTKIWESAMQEAFGEHSEAVGVGSRLEHHHDPFESSSQHQLRSYHDRPAVASSFQQRKKELQNNPREVEFFELLHAEFSKASKFFDKAQQQFIIREELVSVGMQVLRNPHSPERSVKHRWGLLSKAVFLLFRDLLLFEVFAIMTYFAFSKILKKHDKVTGYHTRGAFMVNVVNKV
jgi:hypothetical protein